MVVQVRIRFQALDLCCLFMILEIDNMIFTNTKQITTDLSAWSVMKGITFGKVIHVFNTSVKLDTANLSPRKVFSAA